MESAVSNAERRAQEALEGLKRKQRAEEEARVNKEIADRSEAEGRMRIVIAENRAEALIQKAMLVRAGTIEKQRMKEEVQTARSELERLEAQLDKVSTSAKIQGALLEKAEREAKVAALNSEGMQKTLERELLEARHQTELSKVYAMEVLLGEKKAHEEALKSARSEMSAKYEMLQASLDDVTQKKHEQAVKNTEKMIRIIKGNALSTTFHAWTSFTKDQIKLKAKQKQALRTTQKMIGVNANKLLSTTFIAWRMWAKEEIENRARSERFAESLQREAAAAMEQAKMKVLDTERAAEMKRRALEESYKHEALKTEREAYEAVKRMQEERSSAEAEAKKLQDEQRQRFVMELERQRNEHEQALDTARSQLDEAHEATIQEITMAKDQALQDALLKKDAEYRAVLQKKEADAAFAETVLKHSHMKSKAENLLKRAMSARSNSLQQNKLMEQSREAERAVELANLEVVRTKREAETRLRDVDEAGRERLVAAVRQAEVW